MNVYSVVKVHRGFILSILYRSIFFKNLNPFSKKFFYIFSLAENKKARRNQSTGATKKRDPLSYSVVSLLKKL